MVCTTKPHITINGQIRIHIAAWLLVSVEVPFKPKRRKHRQNLRSTVWPSGVYMEFMGKKVRLVPFQMNSTLLIWSLSFKMNYDELNLLDLHSSWFLSFTSHGRTNDTPWHLQLAALLRLLHPARPAPPPAQMAPLSPRCAICVGHPVPLYPMAVSLNPDPLDLQRLHLP